MSINMLISALFVIAKKGGMAENYQQNVWCPEIKVKKIFQGSNNNQLYQTGVLTNNEN